MWSSSRGLSCSYSSWTILNSSSPPTRQGSLMEAITITTSYLTLINRAWSRSRPGLPWWRSPPLHHLWYLMPKKHMLFLYWIIQYCAIHTIHAILVYWANAANNTNGFVFYLFQFRVKNQKDWYQTLFPTHEDIWPFDSPVNTTVHILLEIPPSHELYFFWITLTNELIMWFGKNTTSVRWDFWLIQVF